MKCVKSRICYCSLRMTENYHQYTYTLTSVRLPAVTSRRNCFLQAFPTILNVSFHGGVRPLSHGIPSKTHKVCRMRRDAVNFCRQFYLIMSSIRLSDLFLIFLKSVSVSFNPFHYWSYLPNIDSFILRHSRITKLFKYSSSFFILPCSLTT